MARKGLNSRLFQAIRASGLLRRGDRIVVGVSGGPDSMALLEALRIMAPRQRWRLHAAHLNHGLRGRASGGDASFVRRWAKKSGIPLTCGMGRFPAGSRKKLGTEGAARQIRYGFLEKTARRLRADKIALAHTADDQAETVLWRMIRGSVAGPVGIPESRPAQDARARIVRPLLNVPKGDILTFLKQRHIPYRVDASNRDTAFTRNRIRHRLIPYLQRNYNPSVVKALQRTAQALRTGGRSTAKRKAGKKRANAIQY